MRNNGKFSSRKSTFTLIAASVSLLFFVALVFAAAFDMSLSIYLNADSTIAETGAVNETFNITINNGTASFGPIIHVNVTLNGSFVFTGNNVTNGTSSHSFISSGSHLNWTNTTAGGINGTIVGTTCCSVYFSFNTTVGNLTNATEVTFNVSVMNASGDINYTLLSFKVKDTHAPRQVDYGSGTSANNSNTTDEYFFVNATYRDNAEGSFKVAFFQLWNTTTLMHNLSNATLVSTNNNTWINFTASNTPNLTQGEIYRVNVTLVDTGDNSNTTIERYFMLGFIHLNVSSRTDFGNLQPTNTSKTPITIENKNTTNSTNVSERQSLILNVSKSKIAATNGTHIFYFIVPDNVNSQTAHAADNDTSLAASVSSSNTSNTPGITEIAISIEGVNSTNTPLITATLTLNFTTSKWINSSFTSPTNITNLSNSNYTVNITANESTANGVFAGFLSYSSSSPNLGSDFTNITFNVSAPEIMVQTNYSGRPSLTKTGTLYVKVNSGTSNHSVNITIENHGNSTLHELSVTWSNTTNFIKTSDSTVLMNFSNGSAPLTTLTPVASSPNKTNYIITLVPNASANGNYTNVLYVNTSNGQPYKNHSIIINVFVSDEYLATINSIGNNGTNPRPNATIKLQVNATYQNGTPVTNLNGSHFTVYDKFGSALKNVWNYSTSGEMTNITLLLLIYRKAVPAFTI